MKTSFQAKDIQKMLDIPRHRYEYLARASNFGIEPEVAGDGKGRTNLYSFKNLLEFAIAHKANVLGLGPSLIRDMLSMIHTEDMALRNNVYDPALPETRSFFVARRGDYWMAEFTENLPYNSLAKFDGFIVVNVGRIKAEVIEYTKE